MTLALVVQELDDDVVELLGRLGHHQVGAVADRDEARVRDLVGELAVEGGRRESVAAPAQNQSAMGDLAQPVSKFITPNPIERLFPIDIFSEAGCNPIIKPGA